MRTPFLHLSQKIMTLDISMGNSMFATPPFGCSGPGLRYFFLLLIPSTMILPDLTFKTLPRLPRSAPAVTTILSFFFIRDVVFSCFICSTFLKNLGSQRNYLEKVLVAKL